MTVDALYTVADILGPIEHGADHILMVSGLEEAYFTELSRLALSRQAAAGDLDLGWRAELGALYFRVLEGLGGYPKMSKSIPASSIHLGMALDDIAARIADNDHATQPALLSAIELSSGWSEARLTEAATAYQNRRTNPRSWHETKDAYLETFTRFGQLWKECQR